MDIFGRKRRRNALASLHYDEPVGASANAEVAEAVATAPEALTVDIPAFLRSAGIEAKPTQDSGTHVIINGPPIFDISVTDGEHTAGIYMDIAPTEEFLEHELSEIIKSNVTPPDATMSQRHLKQLNIIHSSLLTRERDLIAEIEARQSDLAEVRLTLKAYAASLEILNPKDTADAEN